MAAYLVGRSADSLGFWARAHHEFLNRGLLERAVRCAFWLTFGLLEKGEQARGNGWLSRAKRLLDDGCRDCVEQGYLLLPAGLQRIRERDHAAAYACFMEAAQVGARFSDSDLVALGRHGAGRALIRMGQTREGVALLDEAMAAVEAREVSSMVVGDVYCGVISGCFEVFDLRRAQEWTASLTHWCESHPDLVRYNGECLLRRAEIMQLHGAWSDASETARQARERCIEEEPDPSVIGAAFYRQAELHRLEGEFGAAEHAYREASRLGRKPQPGLAQLRLAQGRIDAAAAAIRSAVEETLERAARSRLLPAYVDIMLAASEIVAARAAADELLQLARELDAALMHAIAAQAHGAVLLAQGDARSALTALRQAWAVWLELEAPYEAARVRVLTGSACQQLGDQDSAALEFDAARWVFQRLGATPDAARVDKLSGTTASGAAAGLTARETQVLRLLAAGKTNRAIATELFISEKTVARHVSNIFTKLRLSTRAAAAAYAYQHDLA